MLNIRILHPYRLSLSASTGLAPGGPSEVPPAPEAAIATRRGTG